MSKLENKELKFEAPFVKDMEVHRAITKIYKDLNELAKSTNNFQLKEEGANTEGKEGDIKVVKSTEDDGYALQIRSDKGWLEDKTAKYVSINDNVSVKTEQKKKTLPSTVGSLLPSPDFDTGWVDMDRTDAAKRELTYTHSLGSPDIRLAQCFVKDTYGDNSGASATNAVFNYFRVQDNDSRDWDGFYFEILPTELKVWAYASHHLFHAFDGVNNHRDWDRMDVRILLWK